MVVAEPVVSRGRLTVPIVSTASAGGPAGSVTRGRVVPSGRRVITVPLGPRSTIVSTGSLVISRVITVCALAAPAPAASASATAAWRICVLMGFSLQSPNCPKQQVNAGFPSPVPMEPGRLRRTGGGRGRLRHIHTIHRDRQRRGRRARSGDETRHDISRKHRLTTVRSALGDN